MGEPRESLGRPLSCSISPERHPKGQRKQPQTLCWVPGGTYWYLTESSLWAATGDCQGSWCPLPPVSHGETAATIFQCVGLRSSSLGLAILGHVHHTQVLRKHSRTVGWAKGSMDERSLSSTHTQPRIHCQSGLSTCWFPSACLLSSETG